eukprot:m.552184 g.552184  ORF g.552184 m.552184 type:complete len:381 (-) comp57738_c0_seq5:265-1407(-)
MYRASSSLRPGDDALPVSRPIEIGRPLDSQLAHLRLGGSPAPAVYSKTELKAVPVPVPVPVRSFQSYSTSSQWSDSTHSVSSDHAFSDIDPNSPHRSPAGSGLLHLHRIKSDRGSQESLSTSPTDALAAWAPPAYRSPVTEAALHAFLRFAETEEAPQHGFLDTIQAKVITPIMRTETLVWLDQLVKFHECETSVFCCAAELFDRVLAATKLQPKFLRIVAVVCFLLASKGLLDEMDQPLVKDLVQNCEGEFTASDLKRMEIVILKKLQWQLPSRSHATVLEDLAVVVFADLGLPPAQVVPSLPALTAKFSELAFSYDLQRHKVSVLAAAVLAHELPNMTTASECEIIELLAVRLQCTETEITSVVRPVGRHLRVVATMF